MSVTLDQFKTAFRVKAQARNPSIRWGTPKRIWHKRTSLREVDAALDRLGDPPTQEQLDHLRDVITAVPQEKKVKYKAALDALTKRLPLLEPDFGDRVEEMLTREAVESGKEAADLGDLPNEGTVEGFDNVAFRGPNDLEPRKVAALKAGLEMVRGLGFDLPDMQVHFAPQGSRARNVAFMREGDEDAINLYLSADKLLAHSKMRPDSDGEIQGGCRDAKAGGVGVVQSGPRGVPDQIADRARGEHGNTEEGDRLANEAYAQAIIVHELGHVLHSRLSPEIFWAMKTEPGAFLDWFDLASQVSEYGCQNSLEFVAEVFTGRVHGLAYNATVLERYEEFGGPPVG